jgi:hypothetical protein
MSEQHDPGKKGPTQSFNDMIDALGNALSETFNDPTLKDKARDLGRSAADSAEELGNRFRDEAVKRKFEEFGRSTQAFGQSMGDWFSGESARGPSSTGQPAAGAPPPPPPQPTPSPAPSAHAGRYRYHRHPRWWEDDPGFGRIGGSIAAIAWSFIIFVLFNFFSYYVAWWQPETAAGAGLWVRYPVLTTNYAAWLPVLNTALMVGIASYFVVIILDNRFARLGARLARDAASLASTVAFLQLFPLDFSRVPVPWIAQWGTVTLTVILIIAVVGTAIGIITNLVRLGAWLARDGG